MRELTRGVTPRDVQVHTHGSIRAVQTPKLQSTSLR